MIRYWLNSGVIACAIALFGSLYSCTKVENDFGEGFIPGSQIMQVRTGSIDGIEMQQTKCDSILTSSWGLGYFGSNITTMFGRIDVGCVVTLLPGSFDSSDSLWGVNPTVDSVLFEFYSDAIQGDTLQELEISIRQLTKKTLPYMKDSEEDGYYSNFNLAEYQDDDVLATFTLTTGSSFYDSITLPAEFGEQFLDTSGMTYLYDSLFIKKFGALSIESEKVTSGGVIHSLDTYYSSITIYYHNENPTPDTTSVSMLTYYSSTNYNMLFSTFSHDYSFADPIVGVNPDYIDNDDIVPNTVFIEGLSGTMGKINFPKDEIEALKSELKAEGYSTIGINNATLSIDIYSPSIPNYDNALTALGLMQNYEDFELINDYYPFDEGSDDLYTPDFGGLINRAKGTYSMDITSYIQNLFNNYDGMDEDDYEDYDLELGPSYLNYSSFNGTCLSNDNITLTLTYTILE